MLRASILLYDLFVIVFSNSQIRWRRTLVLCYGVCLSCILYEVFYAKLRCNHCDRFLWLLYAYPLHCAGMTMVPRPIAGCLRDTAPYGPSLHQCSLLSPSTYTSSFASCTPFSVRKKSTSEVVGCQKTWRRDIINWRKDYALVWAFCAF